MEEIFTCVVLGDAVVVDGCKDGSNEPGALEFDWLEVQLDSFRERGMQVSRSTLDICEQLAQEDDRIILILHAQVWLTGHVPPKMGRYFDNCVSLAKSPL
jgi:endopolyphosphatase